MSDIVYVPIMKTGDAEIRGLENLADTVKDRITPLIELTRSRKSKNLPSGKIERRLVRFKEAYDDREFILDLTSDVNLSNSQIEELQATHDGYINWVDFLVSLQQDFSKIIPVIQISDKNVKSEKEFYDRIKKQVKHLDEYFNYVSYRFPLEYESYSDDLEQICDAIDSDKIVCVIDAGFIAIEKAAIYLKSVKNVLNEIKKYSLGKIILSGTSFPKNAADHGEKNGEIPLEECSLYEMASKATPELIYGDYATLNPIRSLQAGGNGWVPRIDMPTEKMVYFHRSKKSTLETSYISAYTRVAKSVIQDKNYKPALKLIGDCWGTEQIELAAQGDPQGLSPSFWISARMNIHMTIRNALI